MKLVSIEKAELLCEGMDFDEVEPKSTGDIINGFDQWKKKKPNPRGGSYSTFLVLASRYLAALTMIHMISL